MALNSIWVRFTVCIILFFTVTFPYSSSLRCMECIAFKYCERLLKSGHTCEPNLHGEETLKCESKLSTDQEKIRKGKDCGRNETCVTLEAEGIVWVKGCMVVPLPFDKDCIQDGDTGEGKEEFIKNMKNTHHVRDKASVSFCKCESDLCNTQSSEQDSDAHRSSSSSYPKYHTSYGWNCIVLMVSFWSSLL